MAAQVEKRLRDCRLRMMLAPQSAFFVSLAYNLPVRVTEQIPTAATDGETVLFNPKFVEELTPEQLLFLYLHELMHCVLQHKQRCGNKDKCLWNMAGDYVINLLLVEQGFKMPEGGLLDYQYKDMTTEEVYEHLVEEQPDTSDFQVDLVAIDNTGNSEGNQQGQSPGAVQNTSGSSDGSSEAVARALRIAIQQARMAGKDPGTMGSELREIIDLVFSTQIDWKNQLQQLLGGMSERHCNWARPRKRYLPHYLPRYKMEGVRQVYVAVDVSGSVSQEGLFTCVSEAYWLFQTLKPKEIRLVTFSRGIQESFSLRNAQDLQTLAKKGMKVGGGTYISEVMEDIQDQNPEVVVIFSDGFFHTPSKVYHNKTTRYFLCLIRPGNTASSYCLKKYEQYKENHSTFPWKILEIV